MRKKRKKLCFQVPRTQKVAVKLNLSFCRDLSEALDTISFDPLPNLISKSPFSKDVFASFQVNCQYPSI